jgi:hypothetical protein
MRMRFIKAHRGYPKGYEIDVDDLSKQQVHTLLAQRIIEEVKEAEVVEEKACEAEECECKAAEAAAVETAEAPEATEKAVARVGKPKPTRSKSDDKRDQH